MCAATQLHQPMHAKLRALNNHFVWNIGSSCHAFMWVGRCSLSINHQCHFFHCCSVRVCYICMPHLDVSSDTQSSAIIYVLCGTDRPSVFGKVCPRVLQSYSVHMQTYLSLWRQWSANRKYILSTPPPTIARASIHTTEQCSARCDDTHLIKLACHIWNRSPIKAISSPLRDTDSSKFESTANSKLLQLEIASLPSS